MDYRAILPEAITSKIRVEGGCWRWVRACGSTGYAHLAWKGTVRDVHRLVFELVHGPIPLGLVVDHLCHNADLTCTGERECLHRRCVNPAHLGLKTPAGNILAGFSPPAINARKTHCAHGHEYTPENTKWETSGWRKCLTCRREYDRRRGPRRARAARAVAL